RFAAGGAVADGNHAELMLADQLLELAASVLLLVLRLMREDDAMFQEVAELVQGGELATVAKAGVDGQHAAVAQRAAQQQAPQVMSEHPSGVILRMMGQLPANLTLQAWQQQAVERAGGAGAEELGVRVVGQRQRIQGETLHRLAIEVELDRQGVLLLAAVDRQDAMRRNGADRLLELEVPLVAEALALLDFFAFSR